MRRRSRRSVYSDDFDDGKVILGVIIVFFGLIYGSYRFNRTLFWILLAVGLSAIGLWVWWLFWKRSKMRGLYNQMKQMGRLEELNNFIERFGKEVTSRSVSAWRPREGYAFSWKRLEDFRDRLIEEGVKFPKKDFSEDEGLDYYTEAIFSKCINDHERGFLDSRISAHISHSFSELNKKGDDFEHLIVRLFEAMGYSAKRIGGVGDQGGDVIAARDGHSCLIQAKCYTLPVGNSAVQQAVAARNHYKCTEAVVATTSSFTAEAKALAHSNAVTLVDRNKLQELLVKYLHESWQ